MLALLLALELCAPVRLKPDAAYTGQAAVASGTETVAEIRVHGNVATPDDEVRRLAGIEIGAPFTAETLAQVTSRLENARRFESVDVLKRYASIADPSQVLLVIVVDEGRVKIEGLGDVNEPVRVVRRGGLGLMFMPLLDYEDGYGFTYGAQLARADVIGKGSRLSFPLTWGGTRQAAAQLEKSFTGVLSLVETGVSISQRTNPYFETDDTRDRVWFRGERAVGGSLRAGGTAAWQHVSFGGATDNFVELGLDVAFDTRLDPMLARNAVYARAAVEHLDFETAAKANRIELEASGYVGLFGQSILVIRAQRQDSSDPLPPYLKPLLGGMSSVRGFRAGTDIGDTLVSGSLEVRAPLTSPLKVAKMGVNAFVDIGTVYDKGQRLSDQAFKEGFGGGVWLSATLLRMSLVVAHGVDSGTRVHFGTTLTF